MWASQVAQWVKNSPAMQETQETWVPSLGREDRLGKEMATHSSILVWRIPMNRGAWQATAHQAPLSMGLSKQEYWSGFPFPTPGDLSSPGTEPMSPVSPALAGGFFTTEPPEKSKKKWACPGFESRTSHNRGEDHTRRLASPTSQFRIPMVGSP